MDADEPTLLTCFDRDGAPHDGKLLASSDRGFIVAIAGHVVAFDPLGWSLPDRAFCVCPEALPPARSAEVTS